jgi:hypothetical protein
LLRSPSALVERPLIQASSSARRVASPLNGGASFKHEELPAMGTGRASGVFPWGER